MIKSRRFKEQDARKVSELVRRTLREINSKDYSEEYIANDIAKIDENFFIERSKWTSCYVFTDEKTERIICVGSIGAYWGSETESSLFTIFVSPDYQGKGIGKKIMEKLESDEYYLRAKRIEIPASITALSFYQKLGYDFKDGVDQVDEEGLYRLEKFR